jgi:hypothetical protein
MYASVWKREADGPFKVVMDVGVPTPDFVVFTPGFVRAPQGDGYTGNDTSDAAMRSLTTADTALTKAALASQADAYRGRIAESGRVHRPGVMPLIGETAALAWLRTQPAYTAGENRFADVARSRDLGYTWGSYAMPQSKGYYTRVWVRGRDAVWKLALDVLQPGAP